MNEFLDNIREFAADNTGWLLLAAAIVVALVVVALVVTAAMKKKRDLDRQHAQAIRTDAARNTSRLDAKDADVRRLEAEAEQAQAEADRLGAVAKEQRDRLDRERLAQAARLEEADRLDRGRRYEGAHR
ncbi:uncharacterized protein YlxW (UPF0749 family) [Nocardioides thalensis]|uniref:Uncharacterized protein YlxW (UPF0749 family) n=1 Tax=Nocardioides thalensis TaxID=1914755 RepID=A0A853C068_9ACTN|nr:hypothetical protein [Nocardioides thalensis]NYJ00426.1 uncharacterized protein YlxW (UPF0749 family) [Nocardioides thalensis]